jgi:hypothetical protein
MKEYCKKFSVENENDHRPEERRNLPDPGLQQRPEFRDLRFVVKESVNLGFRFVSEIERMLKKLEE